MIQKIFIYSILRTAKLFLLICTFLTAVSLQKASAQSIPVGDIKDQQFRTLQLLSDSTVTTSLTNRPLWMSTYRDLVNEVDSTSDSWWAQPLTGPSTNFLNFFKAGIYQPVFTNTYNTALPYGENNGAAWYGKGLNSELQGGFYVTSDFLTVSLRPHLSYTQNSDFPKPRFIPTNEDGTPQYRAIINNIDMPYRFGPDSYTTFDWGHSSARIHYKSIEAGVSTEPLWWGPGVQYALMMSNNAGGFKHLFWGTRKPLKLPFNIGALEFRLVGGWLQDSDYFYYYADRYQRKRFMNAINFSYAPSFIPNFTVGLTRVFHQYVPEDGLDASDFFDVIQPFQKKNQGKGGDGPNNLQDSQNQLVSLYFRWVFPESNTEIYGEYFREDHNYDLRDFLMEPDHDRAYTLGAQKIVESNRIDFVKINAEINSLVPNRLDEVRRQTYYYRHGKIRQGHTNGGEVLGAAIGPGSGSQYVGAEGYFNEGMLGLFIQRVGVNEHFHYEYHDENSPNPAVGDIYGHRINLNIGLKGSYETGPLLLGAKLIWNKNYNYGRYDYGNPDINFDNTGQHDKVNMQLQLSARYLF